MSTALLLKFWREIALAVALLGLGFMVYNHIYDRGAQAATEQYQKEWKDYQQTVSDKIDRIETMSNELVSRRVAKDGLTKKEVEAIVSKYAKIPLVDPVACVLTPGFANSYNEIIDRANK